MDTNAATCYHSNGENAPISTPWRAHQNRRAAPSWRLGSAPSCCRFSEEKYCSFTNVAAILYNARLERFTASSPTSKFKSSLGSRWSSWLGSHARSSYHFCVFTITLLVASRKLLSSATGEQVVGDTMVNASLLGLIVWSVIMINLNTWNKSIGVFESLFDQHCKSRQSTNLNTGIFFKQNVARFFMVQVDMFKEVHCLHFSAEFLVMSPQPLFGLQGSSRGLRRQALGLAVLAHVQRVSGCHFRLPVRKSITCFLLRCKHEWRLQSVTTGFLARRVSRRVPML